MIISNIGSLISGYVHSSFLISISFPLQQGLHSVLHNICTYITFLFCLFESKGLLHASSPLVSLINPQIFPRVTSTLSINGLIVLILVGILSGLYTASRTFLSLQMSGQSRHFGVSNLVFLSANKSIAQSCFLSISNSFSIMAHTDLQSSGNFMIISNIGSLTTGYEQSLLILITVPLQQGLHSVLHNVCTYSMFFPFLSESKERLHAFFPLVSLINPQISCRFFSIVFLSFSISLFSVGVLSYTASRIFGSLQFSGHSRHFGVSTPIFLLTNKSKAQSRFFSISSLSYFWIKLHTDLQSSGNFMISAYIGSSTSGYSQSFFSKSIFFPLEQGLHSISHNEYKYITFFFFFISESIILLHDSSPLVALINPQISFRFFSPLFLIAFIALFLVGVLSGTYSASRTFLSLHMSTHNRHLGVTYCLSNNSNAQSCFLSNSNSFSIMAQMLSYSFGKFMISLIIGSGPGGGGGGSGGPFFSFFLDPLYPQSFSSISFFFPLKQGVHSLSHNVYTYITFFFFSSESARF